MKKIKKTKHLEVRQSQRGISTMMVEYVISNGTEDKDKYILGKKEILARLSVLDEERRLLMKINDKGGVVVVADGETVITTYNLTPHRNKASSHH